MDLDMEFLLSEYESIREDGYKLAGGLCDLSQRASIYYHMYEDSGGRNVFPLIAAHGALWASGYFSKGMKVGKILSIQYLYNPKLLFTKYSSLKKFADAFRDINRRVCAEAYCVYHFTKKYGHTDFSRNIVPLPLLEMLNLCHFSKKRNTHFSQEHRKKLFEAFFLWEQEVIVSPAVETAIKNFDWPLVKFLAMRPKIEFSYFDKKNGLQFVNFSSRKERIALGLQAYELAELVGFKFVEESIKSYKIMPNRFFDNTSEFFLSVKEVANCHSVNNV